jgi:fatty-acid desaturase
MMLAACGLSISLGYHRLFAHFSGKLADPAVHTYFMPLP